MRTFVGGFAAAALSLTLGAGTAQAVPLYCSATDDGSDALTTPSQPLAPDGLSVNDVTLEGIASSDCYGVVAGNDDIDVINDLTEWDDDGDFTAFLRDEGTTSTDFLGWTWTLDAELGTNGQSEPGEWSLSLSGGDPAELPVYADLVVVLKGGSNWAGYFFDDFAFDLSNDGTFVISFLNNGGNFPGLSHMSVYLRGGDTPATEDPPNEEPPSEDPAVPEPGSLLLLGTGLALAGRRFRRRKE